MALTAENVLKYLEHSLAGSTELESLSLMNQAGRHLVGMRSWRWLIGAKATLGTVNGNEYVTLPADCKRVDAIEQTNSLVGSIQYVSLRDFLSYKTSTIVTSPISFWATTVFARDTYAVSGAEKPGAPTLRLEVFPTPTATNATAFTIYYSRGWTELLEDNQELSIPAYMEALYIATVRAFALGYEEEDTATVDVRLRALKNGSLHEAALREDSQAQPSYGILSGGIADRGSVLSRWSGSTISDL